MSTQANEIIEAPRTEDARRAYAIKRIKDKNDLLTHAIVYVAINGMLVVLWLMVSGGRFFFWPIVPIFGWGIGLLMHAYSVFRGNIVTEGEIQREIKKLPG